MVLDWMTLSHHRQKHIDAGDKPLKCIVCKKCDSIFYLNKRMCYIIDNCLCVRIKMDSISFCFGHGNCRKFDIRIPPTLKKRKKNNMTEMYRVGFIPKKNNFPEFIFRNWCNTAELLCPRGTCILVAIALFAEAWRVKLGCMNKLSTFINISFPEN